MFKAILVPTDGGTHSLRAIDEAIDYCRMSGGKLIGLAVIEPVAPYPGFGGAAPSAARELAEIAHMQAEKNISDFVLRVTAAGLPYETSIVTDERPWSAIILTAEARLCQAIFMGSHGRRGVESWVMGSTTQKVLVHCKLPVLVVR